jgi:hypothetical protein
MVEAKYRSKLIKKTIASGFLNIFPDKFPHFMSFISQ